MATSVIILQPPLVQLNGPYPAGAYLAAFFRSLAKTEVSARRSSAAEKLPFPRESCPEQSASFAGPSFVRWVDASNIFFHRLFCRTGTARLFSLCRESALETARRAENSGDPETAFQLRRYLSFEDRWCEWIDGIVSILCGGDRELCHAFVRSPYAPRGARMDAFLSGLETEPTADDARLLATLAIEDLSDFIASAFDSEFSLVRYAESIAASERHFAKIEAALSRPMVRDFLEPMCDQLWKELTEDARQNSSGASSGLSSGRILFCLSVPFPGCLVNALAMARSIRHFFGDRAVISLGGGYVNTELRDCDNERLFAYVDSLSFDRGFGGYADFFRHDSDESYKIPQRLFCPPDLVEYEDRVTAAIVPDYSGIDFTRYPRLADDPNPMHRLWSDGTWIKAFLAHGCYWHRCSFCDVSLDYICAYRPVDVPNLYAGLRTQALATGVHGIHFVDEAAPPRALRDFAEENLKAARNASRNLLAAVLPGAPGRVPFSGLLSYWGNIRFEKTFTRDLADFLASSGLVGVSGGIEIASPEGFKSVDKGIDLENLVAVCAAFKEAGVLVHSYLIYGYWNEDAQGVIDAAEVMRQLFSAGLVDSAFWHKFVLTRHSRVYREWEGGLHREKKSPAEKASADFSARNAAASAVRTEKENTSPDAVAALRPIDEPGDFADNDIRFDGETNSERYTAPLDAALQSWMSGEGLDKPVRKWFPFSMPQPRIAGNLINTYIASYEKRRDNERNRPCDPEARYYWTGSIPVSAGNALVWWHLGEEIRLELDAPILAAVRHALLPASDSVAVTADTAALALLPRQVFRTLRANGLCLISPL